MSSVVYPRPLEPLVSQNPFRGQGSIHEPIPSFIEAKELLPQPVIADHPEWVEMYWRAWELAWGHLRRPKAGVGFVSNYIDPAFNDNLHMGPMAFNLFYGMYGRYAFNFVASLNNFYAKQHDDGFICREIHPDGEDCYTPFDPNSTGPNLLAWAEWRHFRQTGDNGRLAQVFWPLMAYHRWCRANRTWPSGLYWATGLSSGMENQPRIPNSRFHHRHWAWVDASMQASLNCLALGQIATLLQEADLARELAEERSHLMKMINDRLWNSQINFYQDADVNGRYSPIKSIAAYWGLLDKDLIPEDRLSLFLQPLHENWAFKMPHRVPTQSADSEGYNSETGNGWRGAVCPATNYMIIRGLRHIGQTNVAFDIALNHLQHVCTVYQRTDTFWENYAPETAVPGDPARPDFVGWAGLTPISLLLEEIIGLNVDWPLRRVTWDRRLDTPNDYGVRNYPLGEDGTLEIMGNRERLTIITDVPFTLIMQDAQENLQAAVPAGTTEINLT